MNTLLSSHESAFEAPQSTSPPRRISVTAAISPSPKRATAVNVERPTSSERDDASKRRKTLPSIEQTAEEDPSPEFRSGTRVLKYFEDYGWFIGRVVDYNQVEDLYLVAYTDGDAEHLDPHNVRSHLLSDTAEVPAVDAVPEHAETGPKSKSSHLWSTVEAGVKRHFDSAGSPYSVTMAEFFLFCYERHNMWLRRNLAHCEPWSLNPVLQKHHWCNVWRELDRGTSYFHSKVVAIGKVKFGSGITRVEWLDQVLWLSYVYRLVNKVESFERTGFPPRTKQSVRRFLAKCQSIVDEGNVSLFTCAHQTPGFSSMVSFLNNSFAVWSVCMEALTKAASHEERISALRLLPGVGLFQAWQVLCDLDESECFQESVTTTNVELGPGSEAGLRLIFPTHETKCKPTQQDLARQLVRDQMTVYAMLGIDFPTWNERCMGLKEMEHALCEFGKYKKLESSASTKGRYYRSRAFMDCNKLCQRCRVDEDSGVLCDLCNEFWCTGCVANATAVGGSYWICEVCAQHQAHSWA